MLHTNKYAWGCSLRFVYSFKKLGTPQLSISRGLVQLWHNLYMVMLNKLQDILLNGKKINMQSNVNNVPPLVLWKGYSVYTHIQTYRHTYIHAGIHVDYLWNNIEKTKNNGCFMCRGSKGLGSGTGMRGRGPHLHCILFWTFLAFDDVHILFSKINEIKIQIQ